MHINAALNDFTKLFFANFILDNVIIALNNFFIRIFKTERPFQIELVTIIASVNKA